MPRATRSPAPRSALQGAARAAAGSDDAEGLVIPALRLRPLPVLPRPEPPAEGDPYGMGYMVPAPELERWARAMFVDEGARLVNPAHEHLRDAELGFLWTDVEHVRQQRTVIATAEMPNERGTWKRARAEAQFRAWWGRVPDFIITVHEDAAHLPDASFCALLEHELYHCAQALKDGFPAFSRETGLPLYAMRGHDAEEFVGVVERYGVGAAASGVRELVEAAAKAPSVSPREIAAACGTCDVRPIRVA